MSDCTLAECKTIEQAVTVFSKMLQSEREAHLAAVDRIERVLGIEPRTAVLRKIGKTKSDTA